MAQYSRVQLHRSTLSHCKIRSLKKMQNSAYLLSNFMYIHHFVYGTYQTTLRIRHDNCLHSGRGDVQTGLRLFLEHRTKTTTQTQICVECKKPLLGATYISYKGPLKDVFTWRGSFEPSEATSFMERECVRIGYICGPKQGFLFHSN